ncbi:MAG: hypothetical protein ACK6C4_00305, partial [Bacteroidota bacterium]
YAQQAYAVLHERQQNMIRDNAQGARDLLHFESEIARNWPAVRVVSVVVKGHQQAHIGERLIATARVHIGNIRPEDVRIELIHGPIDARNEIRPQSSQIMHMIGMEDGDPVFEGSSMCTTSGYQGCTVRIMPSHPAYMSSADAGRATYAHPA